MSRILVVDDEPDIRMTLRLILQLAGYAVTEAASGGQAIELARDGPDAILLDIRLPDIDGLDVLRALKGDPALATIPVVCVTAHSSGETRRQALALGATGYVNKPFDIDEVRAVVDAAVVTRTAAP
jgi:CheY-like chemotaxis protein